MWFVPIRPDLNYAVKELSRSLQNPAQHDLVKAKRVLRYLQGTRHYSLTLFPHYTAAPNSNIELQCFVDSDWAECKTTR